MNKAIFFLLLSGQVMAQTFYKIDDSVYSYSSLKIINYSKQEISMAQHIYTNAKASSKRVMHIIPGYAENCGYMKNLTKFYLDRSFKSVNCYELPGHGSSSGTRYDIDHFDTYKIHLKKIINTLTDNDDHYFLGHSTGCVGMGQYLLEKDFTPFKKIILIAPLIRVRLWPIVKLGHLTLGKLIDNIPRFSHKRGAEYKVARDSDPYISETTPTHWLDQLMLFYNTATIEKRKSQEKILIIYGDQDDVIDWKFSKKYYAKHFPNADIKVIKDGTHHPYFNSPTIRSMFYNILKK